MKKFLSILCLCSILFTSCTFIGEKSKNVEVKEQKIEKDNDEGTHNVIDHAGNTVKVPNNIKRVVIDQVPIVSTYMSYFQGKTPYIVGYAGAFKETIEKTVLKEIAPELLNITETVKGQSDLNVEEIMKLKPDLIIYNAGNKKHAEELKRTGIPMVGFATVGYKTPADSLVRYKEWLTLLEEVFNEKGKMDNMFKFGDEIVKDVKDRISKIPESERPSAMILFKYMKGELQIAGKGTFGDFWLKNLGIKNVAGETNGFAIVNLEEIYKWNPEILFLNGPGHIKIPTQMFIDNKVEGIDFSSVSAIKNKKVFNTSLGMWNWFTPNPDAPLVFAWLATKTYPEQFKDYPLKEKIKEYYKTFYNYDVKDDEIESMLSLK